MVKGGAGEEEGAGGDGGIAAGEFAGGDAVGDDEFDLAEHGGDVLGDDVGDLLDDVVVDAEELGIVEDFAALDFAQGVEPGGEALGGGAGAVLGDGLEGRDDGVEPAEGDGVNKGLLAGEVAVDVAVAHVEGSGDVDDVGLLDAVAAQGGLGGIEDALGGGGFLRHGAFSSVGQVSGGRTRK